MRRPQTDSKKTTSELAAMMPDDSGGASASEAARADRGKVTGSSEDDHRQGAGAKLFREVRVSIGRQGHCRLVDRGEQSTSAGGAATEGPQAAECAELAGEIDEMESRVR